MVQVSRTARDIMLAQKDVKHLHNSSGEAGHVFLGESRLFMRVDSDRTMGNGFKLR